MPRRVCLGHVDTTEYEIMWKCCANQRNSEEILFRSRKKNEICSKGANSISLSLAAASLRVRMDLQRWGLSLWPSLLINGCLPQAVFPPSPAAQPLIIPFNSWAEGDCPRLGADSSPLLSLKNYHGGTYTLNRTLPFYIHSFFFLSLGSLLFSFSHSPSPRSNYQRDLLWDIFDKFCRHRPWCGLSSHSTDMLELKMKSAPGRQQQSPSLGLCSFGSERISWDNSRMFWMESLGHNGCCYRQVWWILAPLCPTWRTEGKGGQGWGDPVSRRDLVPVLLASSMTFYGSLAPQMLTDFSKMQTRSPFLF